MNQRFQSAEIALVSDQFADDLLYKAINEIGLQLEAETAFGMCPEECFTDAVEILSVIAEKGEEIVPEIEKLWLSKYNEYRRLDRKVSEEETRKVVGILFGFVVLAIDSSNYRFYRYELSRRLTELIVKHKFTDWTTTLDRIFSVPLPDGWFDAFIEQAPENESDVMELTKGVSALRKQMPCPPTVLQFVQNQYNTSCQQFMGKMVNPHFITPQNDEAI